MWNRHHSCVLHSVREEDLGSCRSDGLIFLKQSVTKSYPSTTTWDQTALDELGIGTVRDAFSDMLFPGISTLQTRAKYFVILPYLFAQAENHRFKHRRDVLAYIHNEEFTLVKTLVKNSGPEAYGIVGSRNMERW